ARDAAGFDFHVLTDHADFGRLSPTEWALARTLATYFTRPDRFIAFSGFEWNTDPSMEFGHRCVIYPTDDYWPRVREVCTRHDVLLIADEVITGFCRTGRWFALTHWNVKPDILSFAKGVTSGYLPLGGIMVSKAIKDAMDSVKPEDRWMHAYTYSAHPTCCAVGLKNLEIMTRERLWENAAKMGERLFAGLRQAFGDHPNVGDIRGGKGLLAALELVEDRASKKNFAGDRKVAARLQAEMMKRGVVTRTRPAVGPHPSPGDAVFYAPPLVVTDGEIDRLIGVSRDAVKAVLGA
ncbi:MAG: aminotransferase class III-fold pyridoxal phosphate-dependent enzyme, partial [candidate division NC10 bacterium]